ncbi:hypothetical protein [Rubrolithibacter danxiaensis]|uniref:hypothetical protein n=1 Tax=Rubrolithibacter danxiaensis TaxID=3390805 RepID=UPI003BF7E0E4
MKNIRQLMALIVACVILFNGCKKDTVTESKLRNQELQMKSKTAAKQTSAELKKKLNQFQSSLSTNSKQKLKQNLALLLKIHPEYRDKVRKALNIEESTCDDNTLTNQWLDQQLADWNSEIINYVLETAMLDLPTYDALLFENSSANQYFGTNGEYTHQLTKTFKDLKRFWNIESDGIVLAAMHGSMLADRDRLIRTYEAAYGLPPADAEFYADFVLAILDAFPQLRNGDHPIFTFNAFALQSFNFPPYGVIPDKIIMGDGIMEAFTAIGYGDVAPQAILAHEFGHHIQYQLDLFEDEDSPEASRRTELMADAYSAYYLSHARGASMQWKRVKQFLQVFFNIGDCSFTSNQHHGTPAQRMAAAEWGYNLANNAQKQGHILSSQEFTQLFEAQLPQIVQL